MKLKKLVMTVITVIFLLAVLTSCAYPKLAGFALTPEQIKSGALEVTNDLGYQLTQTSYDVTNRTVDGSTIVEHMYTFNDSIDLFISAETSRSSILIAVHEDLLKPEQVDDTVDEWFALLYGVLVTIDPQADFGEFIDALIENDFMLKYHGYSYTSSYDGNERIIMIMVGD